LFLDKHAFRVPYMPWKVPLNPACIDPICSWDRLYIARPPGGATGSHVHQYRQKQTNREVSTVFIIKDRLAYFSKYRFVASSQLDRRDIILCISRPQPCGLCETMTVRTFEQVLVIDVEKGDRAQKVISIPSQSSSQYPAETAGNLTKFATSDYGSVPVTREFQHAN
jgi:hypothetical protein